MKSWDYMDPDLAAAEEVGPGRAGSIESYFSADRRAQQQRSPSNKLFLHDLLRPKWLKGHRA